MWRKKKKKRIRIIDDSFCFHYSLDIENNEWLMGGWMEILKMMGGWRKKKREEKNEKNKSKNGGHSSTKFANAKTLFKFNFLFSNFVNCFIFWFLLYPFFFAYFLNKSVIHFFQVLVFFFSFFLGGSPSFSSIPLFVCSFLYLWSFILLFLFITLLFIFFSF